MIINTGMRTDIPAFYHEWLINRIKERLLRLLSMQDSMFLNEAGIRGTMNAPAFWEPISGHMTLAAIFAGTAMPIRMRHL